MVENQLFSLITDRNPNRVLSALLKDRYPKKVKRAERAIREIRRGSRIFIGTGCGEPQYLIRHLVDYPDARDMELFQILPFTLAKLLDHEGFLDRFTLKAFFVSLSLRRAAEEGKINYVPAYLSEIPTLFDTKRIGLEAALIQVTPPDEHGFCSLGISVDITKSAIRNADLVIAQVNPMLPKTWGDSFVHVDDIDIMVPYEEPLYQNIPPAHNDTARRIGYYVSRLIEDGATLQVGFGKIPSAVLSFLGNKKDLGVHTQMISDGFLELIEKGVITNNRKNLHHGKIITSLAMGTERLYRFVNNNPMVEFHPSEYVNHPNIIAQNDNLVSISTALEIDVTGQVCTDSLGYTFYSGMGDQVDFIRGANRSKGGLSIIALPSTAKNGTVSRIVSHLSEGAGVTNTRADTKYVVTEFGIAQLYGKDIYQRVVELVQVAHPKFRKSLMEKAKQHHYIFKDQIAPSTEDWLALERYSTDLVLADRAKVHFRAIRPSDEFMSRNFFYKLEEKSIYYRFFQNVREWPHEKAQRWTNITYGKDMALVGIIQSEEGVEEIIATGQYAYDPETPGYAMLAFIVREDFHGKGISSFMLKHLEKIAKENHYKGFTATVMEENRPMLHVFRKFYPQAEFSREGGGIVFVRMDFDAPSEGKERADAREVAGSR